MKSPTVIKLRSPVKIFGKINGKYNDLMRYFSLFGRPSKLRGIYKKICDLIDCLPLAAIIKNQIICVHSGIGEHVKNINDINNIKKPYNVKDNIIFQEVLWSSPNNNSNKEE